MSTTGWSVEKREFAPCIEGLRGYCILIVFVIHYLGSAVFPIGSPILRIQQALMGFLFVVPVFFVISGILISDILLETCTKEGLLRVFYLRRLLRICPAYFLTLLVLAAVHILRGSSIDPRFWTQFVFVQNLLPGYLNSHTVPSVDEMGHLWFIAVIVQFYLLWPLVVRLFPNRIHLVRITWTLIAVVCAIRFAAPWLHLSISDCYVSTVTRADAILLGVAISLHRRDAAIRKLEAWAAPSAVCAIGAMVFIALWTGTTWPATYRRVVIINFIANLAAALLVVAVMRAKSRFCYFCSVRWVRWLGNLSFAIYVFHFTYSKWFMNSLAPRLSAFMTIQEALATSALLAFLLTIALALLNRRFAEQPIRSWLARLSYSESSSGPALVKI